MDPLLWSVVLTFLMIVLVAMEMLTPSFGLLTALGVCVMIGSIYVAFGKSQGAGFGMMAVNLTLFPIAIFSVMKMLKHSPLMHEKVIQAGVPKDSGQPKPVHELVGQEGSALTDLRPSGTAQFGEKRQDVVTDGKFVEKGTKVKVLEVEGSRVVVEPLS